MKKRKFKFADGDLVQDAVDTAEAEPTGYVTRPGPGALSFKEKFAQARALGKDEFDWNGKRYTTELAPSKPASRPAPEKAEKPDNSMMEGMRRTMSRRAAESEPQTAPGRIPGWKDQPTRPMSDVEQSRMSSARENIAKILEGMAPSATRAAPALGRGVGAMIRAGMEGAKAGKQEREVAQAAARGAASRKAIQAKRAARETEAEDKFLSPEYGYKRGGSVSASSRADGIAKRGKTRGTMVMCKGGRAK